MTSAVVSQDWEVCVIGAGPAGSTAARLLAQRGLAVLLVDRAEFPRHKVCGCCLNGLALDTLRRTGLSELPEKLGGRGLDTLYLVGFGRHVRVRTATGYSISRPRLDEALAQEAMRAGAHFLPSTTALLGDFGDDKWGVDLRSRSESRPAQVRARVVICADGLEGASLRRHPTLAARVAPGAKLGLSLMARGASDLPAGEVRMVLGKEGYVGAVRLEDDLIDIAAAVSPDAIGESTPQALVERLLEENAPLGKLEVVQGVRGTPPLTRRRKAIGDRQLFILGDAAGYIEPFTGEGIGWAMSSALLLAPLADRACRSWHPRLQWEWQHRWRRQIGFRQQVCRISRFILGKPYLTRFFLSLLCWAPDFVRPVQMRLNRPLRERS